MGRVGCACKNENIEMGPPKELSDLLQGSYSCKTEYEEEDIFLTKRNLQDHYTIMVRQYKENSPDKGEEEETAYVSRYEFGVEYEQREGNICSTTTKSRSS